MSTLCSDFTVGRPVSSLALGLYLSLLTYFCIQEWPLKLSTWKYIMWTPSVLSNNPLYIARRGFPISLHAPPGVMHAFARHFRVLPFIYGLQWILQAVGDMERRSILPTSVIIDAISSHRMYRFLLWWNFITATVAAAAFFCLRSRAHNAGSSISVTCSSLGMFFNAIFCLMLALSDIGSDKRMNLLLQSWHYVALQYLHTAMHTFIFWNALELYLQLSNAGISVDDYAHHLRDFFSYYNYCLPLFIHGRSLLDMVAPFILYI